VNKLRAFRAVAQGLWQWSEIKKNVPVAHP